MKKYGGICKYVYRIEIGKYGAIHVHLFINEIETDVPMVNTRKIITKYWTYGRVYDKPTYEAGGFEGIAVYLCKEADKSKDGKASKLLYPYVPSKNLEKPEHERKTYKRLTMKQIFKEIEERLTLGKKSQLNENYVIDESTIKRGVGPFNGMSFLKYIEMRI